jgi:hypothetical protein
MDPQLTPGQRETLTALPPPWRVEFDELAAYLEYDCGLSRGQAEVRAYHCIANRLDPVPLVQTKQGFYPSFSRPSGLKRVLNVRWVALSWRGMLLRRDVWQMLTIAQFF